MNMAPWLRTLAGLLVAAVLAAPAWAKDDKKKQEEGDDEGASGKAAQQLEELNQQLESLATQTDELMEKMTHLRALIAEERGILVPGALPAGAPLPGAAPGALPGIDAETMRRMMEQYAKLIPGGIGFAGGADPEVVKLAQREAELQGKLLTLAQQYRSTKDEDLQERVQKDMKKVAKQLCQARQERRDAQLEQLKSQLADLEAEAENPPSPEDIVEEALREKTEGTEKPEKPKKPAAEGEEEGDGEGDAPAKPKR